MTMTPGPKLETLDGDDRTWTETILLSITFFESFPQYPWLWFYTANLGWHSESQPRCHWQWEYETWIYRRKVVHWHPLYRTRRRRIVWSRPSQRSEIHPRCHSCGFRSNHWHLIWGIQNFWVVHWQVLSTLLRVVKIWTWNSARKYCNKKSQSPQVHQKTAKKVCRWSFS